MGCERLQYHRQNYWVECFKLILKIIGGVDYKVNFELVDLQIDTFIIIMRHQLHLFDLYSYFFRVSDL